MLNAKLFQEGQKPAVDVGTSVSRVGGKTQAHVLREVSDTLRLDYAQFLELESFTRFGGMQDDRVRQQLTRGARIRAILNQPQHAPLRLADEVALVMAVQGGMLDALKLPDIVTFRSGLRAAINAGAPDAVKMIQDTGSIDETCKKSLADHLATYASTIAQPAPAPQPAATPAAS